MISENLSIVLVFILYLLVVMGVGMYFYRRNETISDYVLGGRKLNSWVAALSAQASDMSGWLLMGLPGVAYLSGMSEIWIGVGLAIGTYLNWKFVAERLRRYTEIAKDSITIPVYLENRFRDQSKLLRIVSAFFIMLFFLLYTSSGLVAGGKLFNLVFGVDYTLAVTIGALVIIGYTFLGGFLAVSWTDFIQGSLMFIAIFLIPIMGISQVGGIDATMNAWNSISPDYLNPFTNLDGESLGIMGLASALAWGLGYFGMPHILVRFMAIKSADKVPKARKIATTWVVISLFMAVLVGMVGAVALGAPLDDPEHVFMAMAQGLFPSLIAGVFLAGVLAAIMSTADSQLLVTASAITEDIYALLNKNASQKELLWISRFAVIVVAAIAYYFAIVPGSSVMGLVSYAWAGFGGAFGPVILLSLYWKRMTRNGALAGLLSGGFMVILWKNLSGGIFDLYEIVPAFLLASVMITVVSLMDKEPSLEIQEEFDRAVSEMK